MSDVEPHLRRARRAAERGDRLDVAWELTQARKAGADAELVEAIQQEVEQ